LHCNFIDFSANSARHLGPGEIASALLQIPKNSYPGIHGEMPNKALPQIIEFYSKRIE